MKRLDRFVVMSFVGPFILTFFISVFVLDMQFLWKYVDDMIGKGLDTLIIVKLIFFFSAYVVTLALPLAILLSSLMIFGNMGEYYELTAVKASGISLFRLMRSLLIVVILISAGAFLHNNYVLPQANLKYLTLLSDIRNAKMALNIQEGIFNSDIDGYSIKVDRKGKDGKSLEGIMIYDHSAWQGNDNLILAERGEMVQTKDGSTLLLKLVNGKQYSEMHEQEDAESKKEKLYVRSFSNLEKHFDLSQFDIKKTDEDFFKNEERMLNMAQLDRQIDTMIKKRDIKTRNMSNNIKSFVMVYHPAHDSLVKKDSLPKVAVKNFTHVLELMDGYSKDRKFSIMENALNKARSIKGFTSAGKREFEFSNNNIASYEVEWYRKISYALACLVMFLIGAPLGSIIRKGGLGWPMFIAILIFILFYVINISGERLAQHGNMDPFTGMWLYFYILMPIGLFLTIKANSDSRIYNREFYQKLLRIILSPLYWISHALERKK